MLFNIIYSIIFTKRILALMMLYIIMNIYSGLNKLLLKQAASNSDDPDMKAMKDMSAGMGMPMAQPQMSPMGGGYDPNPMLKTERNELKIVRHDWMVRDSEKKLLKKWKQQ